MSVVYRTIREQIVEQLRSEVLSGEIAEGESLREQKLAARFGVSRGPIRDALLQLTQEGLLIAEPNRGVRVSGGPSQQIQPLVVETRRRIERFALETVFDTLTADDNRALDEVLARFKSACEKGEMKEVVERDLALHRWIVERVGDADLLAMWLQVIVRMRLRYTRHKTLLDSYREHKRIVDAIKKRDRPAALASLEANIV
ncbi:MAG: GntR family transcriptional regulator [Planctomycetales bacterium]|nr:GntR family transcriptional regulator [Planctomycetales bacterium]MBN8628179.1 GntR family transcriptional regulator [Planctomycetota bacterium]